MLLDALVGLIVVTYLGWAAFEVAEPTAARAAVGGPVLGIVALWLLWRLGG